MSKPIVTKAPTVGVVVLSFNTIQKLRRCLSCIEPKHQTVVVDNASADGSCAMVESEFPHITLIRNQKNVGFGRANNQGASLLGTDLVLFLNSDAYADAGAIDLLAEAFLDPTVIAAGGKLKNPDGSLQQSTANELSMWAVFCEQTYLEKVFPTSKVLSPYWTTTRLAASTDRSVSPQVMGACLMVRMVKGLPMEKFDERFFLYCEDTDLCKRLSRHGKIMYVPLAEFEHDLGSSSSRDPALAVIRYNWGKELYFAIHYGAAASTFCLILDRLGALLRLSAWSLMALAGALRNRSANLKVRLFWRVLTAKRRSP